MAKKVSKNARVAQRAANAGSGRDHVKVIKSIKDPKTGKYSYKEVDIHKDAVKEFFASK
jgi:ribosomal protein L32